MHRPHDGLDLCVGKRDDVVDEVADDFVRELADALHAQAVGSGQRFVARS